MNFQFDGMVDGSINFEWYQPIKAEEYAGLRRFSAGDKVHGYSVALTKDDEKLKANY